MKKNNTPYFPMFVNLENKQIVVFGAGKIALRRVQTLQFFHASILVIAKAIGKDVNVEFTQLIKEKKIKFCEKAFEESDLELSVDIVIAATDDKEINRIIYNRCKEKNICVNTVTDAALCDFYFPAIALKDEVIVGVTGNGSNHKNVAVITKEIRTCLETWNEKND